MRRIKPAFPDATAEFTSKRPISLAGQWDRLLVMRSISKPDVSGWGVIENLVA